jgi:hypothetical protein
MMFRLCIIDNETRLQYVWNGSHTVNVFDHGGNEVDVISFGYNERGTRPEFVEFAAAVEDWINE